MMMALHQPSTRRSATGSSHLSRVARVHRFQHLTRHTAWQWAAVGIGAGVGSWFVGWGIMALQLQPAVASHRGQIHTPAAGIYTANRSETRSPGRAHLTPRSRPRTTRWCTAGTAAAATGRGRAQCRCRRWRARPSARAPGAAGPGVGAAWHVHVWGARLVDRGEQPVTNCQPHTQPNPNPNPTTTGVTTAPPHTPTHTLTCRVWLSACHAPSPASSPAPTPSCSISPSTCLRPRSAARALRELQSSGRSSSWLNSCVSMKARICLWYCCCYWIRLGLVGGLEVGRCYVVGRSGCKDPAR